MTIYGEGLDAAVSRTRERLLAERTPDGHWVGELSASALSTATAVWALNMVQSQGGECPGSCPDLIRRGLDWLAANQNEDGGWGDTVLSKSNISTTLLAWSALAASPGNSEQHAKAIAAAETWLQRRAGGLQAERLAAAVCARYGEDRTFSAPILTVCAMAGRLGGGRDAWRHVAQLPFELAACPHTWWKRLRLPVVSYALPALIAVGQARHHFRPTRNPLARLVRNSLRRRTLEILRGMQPPSGGYLEAVPLTSFVVMSLAAVGEAGHPVVRRGVEFLAATAREDGSWPIDTNLATWVTTGSVAALAASPTFQDDLPAAGREAIRNWLLDQQHRTEHPFTHAAPGGWAWTDLPGGVPDADDTAGALVALRHLEPAAGDGSQRPEPAAEAAGHIRTDARTRDAAARGTQWLLGLQNRDGGIPTFCRGWGKLPFDRSSPDLTAHALAAWTAWLTELPAEMLPQVAAAIARALGYLEHAQSAEGAWTPLWFGNQFALHEENPTYGTASVVAALVPRQSTGRAGAGDAAAARMVGRGVGWLLMAQNWDGAWGGAPAAGSSVEETALAVDALARVLQSPPQVGCLPIQSVRQAVERGTEWLLKHTDGGTRFEPAPIGFYFAALWYYERLYPMIFTLSALERVRAVKDI